MFGSRSETRERFEATVMQHVDAAYNVALWLARNESDAEDLVQDAVLRAYRFFDRFDGREPRSWLLAIVRNCFYSWLRKNRPAELQETLDAVEHQVASDAPTPDVELLRKLDRQQLWEAMGQLSAEIRETLVLREFEGLSYREIADMASVPIGTVMSRLSRGRQQLHRALSGSYGKGAGK